jgi:hypothetical protein
MDTPDADLTIVFLTANEHPPYWEEFHLAHLKKAVGNYPVITSSIKPVDFGINIIQTEDYSHYTMYRQLLRAAKMATTPFIAVAESDVLYSPEHFSFFRPQMDEVAYDMSKWSLYTWRPIFSMKRRPSNAFMIAPREYLIQALEERYGDTPLVSAEKSRLRAGEIGRRIHEKALGLPLRKAVEVWCYNPSVIFQHENALGTKQAHFPFKKTLGEMKAVEIPIWGKAEDLVKEYR